MAALTQTIVPTATIEVFSGLPSPIDVNNIYPRARVIFQPTTALTLKAAGNTNTLNYDIFLPVNYAYRLDTFSISLGLATSTEVSQLEDRGNVFISIDGSAISVMDLVSVGISNNTTVAGGQKTWLIPEKYTELFGVNGLVRINARLFDDDAVNETVALNATTRFSFLQYEIAQVLDVSVNAPQPVSIV